ncbi:hypothetical protein QNO07_20415 [Streptomyces sp. 549]|uniref:hypothetical protein n=1 Tax=Streptomyces sp. 549 TaxID=3049076 RepID=UPI0024C45632|nr:hypothetical protein [Streptomyces sp. 549]MDK1475753.1 hypothetical protein [Streptomyces sp. 549]
MRPALRRTLGAGLLALALPLSGCGGEGAAAPDQAELRARAKTLGVRLELVHVTEVPGYDLASQSVGPIGHDGFTASYVSTSGGGVIQLAVDRGRPEDTHCASEQGAAPQQCERDGKHWYLPGPEQHEYQRAGDGYLTRVTADRAAVDRSTLRSAAENARRADARELDDLLPEATAAPAPGGPGPGSGPGEEPTGPGSPPTERGDLPTQGDGAPDNEVGVGG